MKRNVTVLLLGVAWLMLVAGAAAADELTVDSILTMHRSGAPADVIVTKVDSPASTFAMTAEDLVTLRREGVPQSVVDAIRAHLPGQPDDARLVELVRLIETGMSESIITKQVKQSQLTYALSVNDLLYLEENGAGKSTIKALMATRDRAPAKPAVVPSELVFEDLELVNDGFWRRDRRGSLVMRGDTLRWDGRRSGHDFEFQIPALGKVWYTCESRPSESFCYQLNLKIVKGDVYRFRDRNRDSGSNAAVTRVAEALRTHFPRLPFAKPDNN